MPGIGGHAPAFLLRGVELVFPTTDGEEVIRHDVCAVRHQVAGLPPQLRERILNMPSILGRDIISGFRFVYEHATVTVLLER